MTFIHQGTPCPKGMVSLLGQCYGLVKNTQSDLPDNSNCNWKSGDPNYELAVLPYDGVK
jgi:hypothetical protein